MNRREFDRQFDDMRRRHAKMRRLMLAVIAIVWALVIGTAGWMLTHPEQIGGFAGRIVAGFSDAKVRP